MKKTRNLILFFLIFILTLSFSAYGETINLQTISAGHEHTMAIKEDGSLWAWGSNRLGVFGDGTNEDSLSPKKIMDNVVAISAGMRHSMAIKKDGSLWTWGNESIGDGTNDKSLSPKKIMDSVVAVSAGQGNSVAIKKDGSLWSWGRGSNVPIKVMDDVVDVSTSVSHTMAIKKDGSLWAWGDGGIGNGTFEGSSVPIKIMDNVIDVSAGVYYSMAVKSDGSLWGWGANEFGELGYETESEGENAVPRKIMDNVIKVSAAKMYLGRMGTESEFTMAIKSDGSLWTWGLNGAGQLGNGDLGPISAPKKILDNVVDISTGFAHSMATKSDGSLWVWGLNNQGQLGDGTKTYNPEEYSLVPKKIMDGIMLNSSVSPVTYTYNQSALNIYDRYLYEGGFGVKYKITNKMKPKAGETNIDITNCAIIFYTEDNSINPEINFLKSAELYYGQSVYGDIPSKFNINDIIEGKVKRITIYYEDELEKKEIISSVPKAELVRDHLETCIIIDKNEVGQKWFKDNFGINLGGN